MELCSLRPEPDRGPRAAKLCRNLHKVSRNLQPLKADPYQKSDKAVWRFIRNLTKRLLIRKTTYQKSEKSNTARADILQKSVKGSRKSVNHKADTQKAVQPSAGRPYCGNILSPWKLRRPPPKFSAVFYDHCGRALSGPGVPANIERTLPPYCGFAPEPAAAPGAWQKNV